MSGFHAKANLMLNIIHSGSADLGFPVFTVNKNIPFDWPVGTSAGQANQEFTDTRTLAASTGEDLDLVGSSLKDGLNNNLAFAKVLLIAVAASSANGANIVVSPGTSTSTAFLGPFATTSGSAAIGPGGLQVFANPQGYSVTASTGDLLRIANSDTANSASYDLYIVGHS
jgi:hypothetical protein